MTSELIRRSIVAKRVRRVGVAGVLHHGGHRDTEGGNEAPGIVKDEPCLPLRQSGKSVAWILLPLCLCVLCGEKKGGEKKGGTWPGLTPFAFSPGLSRETVKTCSVPPYTRVGCISAIQPPLSKNPSSSSKSRSSGKSACTGAHSASPSSSDNTATHAPAVLPQAPQPSQEPHCSIARHP